MRYFASLNMTYNRSNSEWDTGWRAERAIPCPPIKNSTCHFEQKIKAKRDFEGRNPITCYLWSNIK